LTNLTPARLRGEEDNELQDADKNIKSESKVMKGGTHNNTTSNIPVLSLELLRVHENATSAQTKKTQSACNLTDITERDESDLTKTYFYQHLAIHYLLLRERYYHKNQCQLLY
jgi:hypothetical protein